MKYGKSKKGCMKCGGMQKYQSAGNVNTGVNPEDPFQIKQLFSYFKEAQAPVQCPPGQYWSAPDQKCISSFYRNPSLSMQAPQEIDPITGQPVAPLDIDQFNASNLLEDNGQDQTDARYASDPTFQKTYDNSLLEYHQNNPNDPTSDAYGKWYGDKYPSDVQKTVEKDDRFNAILIGAGNTLATSLAERARRKRQGQYYMNNLANPYKGILGYNDGLSDSTKYGLVNAKLGGLLSKKQYGGETEDAEDVDDDDFIDYLYGTDDQATAQVNPYSQLTELGAPDISQYKDKVQFQKDLNIWMANQQSAGEQNERALRKMRNLNMANSINDYEDDPDEGVLGEEEGSTAYSTPSTPLAPESYDLSGVKTKSKSVNLSKLNPNLAASVNKMSTLFPGIVVTSGNDATHSRNSAHYDDDAVDIGANSSNKQAYALLKKNLPYLSQLHGFKYIDEGDHIHISKSRLGKLKGGGKIRDNKGYLASNAANFTDKKIIDSNHITTDGMAFPILANGIPLYPNTGDFYIPGNQVTEYPMPGYHTMPDGTLMKDSDMSYQGGGKVSSLEKGQNYTAEQEEQANTFHSQWMDSPMYKQMLNTSDPNNASTIDALRRKNYGDARFVFNPNQKDLPGAAGYSGSTTGQITILPLGVNTNTQGLGIHELSHSIDKPAYGETNRAIPESDILKMKNSRSKLKGLFSVSGSSYIGDPTETRARLNTIRGIAAQSGLYNPYEQPVDKEIYKKLLKNRGKDGDALGELKELYSDDSIIEMLNSISQNQTPIGLDEAKSGGWIKGAVNPAHKGYCTPMTKATCTPRRKAFARRAKAHFKQKGGSINPY